MKRIFAPALVSSFLIVGVVVNENPPNVLAGFVSTAVVVAGLANPNPEVVVDPKEKPLLSVVLAACVGVPKLKPLPAAAPPVPPNVKPAAAPGFAVESSLAAFCEAAESAEVASFLAISSFFGVTVAALG